MRRRRAGPEHAILPCRPASARAGGQGRTRVESANARAAVVIGARLKL
jgi:hypothetical protein